MYLLLKIIWLYPALLTLLWTAFALTKCWTTRLNRPIPFFVGVHPLLFLLNPKNDILVERPSLIRTVSFTVAILIPLVALVLLVFYSWWLVPVALDARKKKTHRQLTRP